MPKKKNKKHINDKEPNFYSEDGRLFLVRCFNCDEKYGKENYLLSVATGMCAWCGWKENENE